MKRLTSLQGGARANRSRLLILGLVVVASATVEVALGQCWQWAPNGVFYSPACGNPTQNPCVYNQCLWASGTCTYDGQPRTIITTKVQNPPPNWFRCVKLPFGYPVYKCAESPVPCGGTNTDYIDSYCTKACSDSPYINAACAAIEGSTHCPGG